MSDHSVAQFAKELLFPNRCVYCNAVIGSKICKPCAARLPVATRVSVAVPQAGHNWGGLHSAVAPYFYIAPINTAILRMKFGQYPANVTPFARAVASAVQKQWGNQTFDFIVPVPTTRAEAKGRNCVLSQATADAVSRELNIACNPEALQKVRETERQMSLSGEARRKNLKEAFAVPRAAAVTGKQILLIDDVLTTGTTLGACAKALLQAGAARVCGATIAVTQEI